nr:G-protein coupled receptor GRL101-like [Lytechinus pictus]
MPHDALRYAMWVIGFGSLFGNSMVIFFRLRNWKLWNNNVQRLFISNLAIADYLMGIYMLVIASMDLYYGELYYLTALTWRESNLCKLIGFVALLSSEATVFLLALITLDRFLCITFPFGTIKFRNTSGRVSLVLTWLLALILSFSPILLGNSVKDFYGFSDVCVGLPFKRYSTKSGYIQYDATESLYIFIESTETEHRPYWTYSIALYLGVNLAVFVLIFLCYVIIFLQVRKSAQTVKSERQQRERKMTIKMALIVGTDFCCWMPVIIMGILSQTGVIDLPVSLYAWAVVFILPINSTLNPYLYTFAALGTCKKQTKSRSIVAMGNTVAKRKP